MKTSNGFAYVILTVLAALLLAAAYFMPDLKGQAFGMIFLIVGAILHGMDPAGAAASADPGRPILPDAPGPAPPVPDMAAPRPGAAPNTPANAQLREG